MATDRSELTKRVIPKMILGNDAPGSLTAPPPPLLGASPAARAAARFAINGSAIVTGGTGDLGFTACRALLEHGLSGLAIFDLNITEGAAKVSALQAEFPDARIEFMAVNVTDAAAVNSAVQAAATLLGGIDIFLCFAGVVGAVHALDTTPETFRFLLDVNTTGSFFCAQAAAKAMKESGRGGSIVLTSSISAHRVNYPQPQVGYNVAKAGVLAMKDSLAAEWATYGIRVNSISPGYMDTILNEGAGLDEHKKEWVRRHPMGRMGQPEELTGAVILLASKAGTYITGADFLVDGGQTIL
ncbi:putative short chain dehydrogenase reductase family protein [Phaeoacremonium minimum UCRPA7]|uniref:D-arabinitol 2-dehydrogenase [ribulose-forming] n=1 Tax=Phaeoacremonium minimum (strain UCR-PA7) TaxID=1286976 RepID=R8BMU9_PHAM7|nr:putative short chain dehydrogenase reductase family protein [Phaeoacremonium minimum UCRPA7]EOO00669.1 putative short chain dehydrogenase reductase family protein [Phaeoacremonium minimum UCRPA7]